MPPVGPRMTADDYWGLPEGTRTELVDGELWDLVAPGRLHQGISMQLGIWFSTRTALRGGPCKVYAAPLLALEPRIGGSPHLSQPITVQGRL